MDENHRKTIGKPLENGGFIGFNGDLDEYRGFPLSWGYPPVDGSWKVSKSLTCSFVRETRFEETFICQELILTLVTIHSLIS